MTLNDLPERVETSLHDLRKAERWEDVAEALSLPWCLPMLAVLKKDTPNDQ